MEKLETRLLEEWKANNDLFKFHEDLKQKRFTYFLTINATFMAFFGVLVKDVLSDISLIKLFGLIVVSIPPFFITIYFIRVDARARAYVDTVKSKLLLIEEEWYQIYPTNCFSTYTEQFAVLVHRESEVVTKYLAIREISNDFFKILIYTKAAYVGEKAIIHLFVFLWGVMFSLAFVAFCWFFVIKVVLTI